MTDKLYVVGLTGPTGSGKSEVARILGAHGIGIINADDLARRVVQRGSNCLKQLVQAFSSDILNTDGTLNRRRLAQLAFASAEQTRLLNSITHPAIIALSKNILREMEQRHELAAVLDAPLLFESGMDSICDKTVAVIAPYSMRLERIQSRDHLSREEAIARMSAQQAEDYYTSRADIILTSEETLAALQTQAAALACRIRGWADEKRKH